MNERITAIAGAAERWANADYPPRVRVARDLEASTGYSMPAIDFALDALFESLNTITLEGLVQTELGGPDAFDAFRMHSGGRVRALPVGEVVIIGSRTTIGVTIPPAVIALLAGNDVVVKDRDDGIAGAFFATVAQELPSLAERARAERWTSHDDPGAAATLGRAGAVVAFGGQDALCAIRARCGAETRFIGFGPRASAGYVTREILLDPVATRAAAGGAARDFLLYDGEGCLSLHVLFVESGSPADDSSARESFAGELAHAAEKAAVEFPAGVFDATKAAKFRMQREAAQFRTALGKGGIYTSESGRFLIAGGDPDRAPSFAPRTLELLTVDTPSQAAEYIRTHGLTLEGFAVPAVPLRADVEAAALAAGASRIAKFGELQRPSPSLPHGGRPKLLDFVRLVSCDE